MLILIAIISFAVYVINEKYWKDIGIYSFSFTTFFFTLVIIIFSIIHIVTTGEINPYLGWYLYFGNLN